MNYPTLDELNELLEKEDWAEFYSAIGRYIQERKKNAEISPSIDDVVVLAMGMPSKESSGAPKLLEELLKAGANPSVVYEDIFADGLNPFTVCLKYGWFDAARVLLKFGAETRARDHLMIAARYQGKLFGEGEYDELVESIRSGANPTDQFTNLRSKTMHEFGEGWVDIERDPEGAGPPIRTGSKMTLQEFVRESVSSGDMEPEFSPTDVKELARRVNDLGFDLDSIPSRLNNNANRRGGERQWVELCGRGQYRLIAGIEEHAQPERSDLSKRPASMRRHEIGEVEWNVSDPDVQKFIEWVVMKEQSRSFRFGYMLNGNQLDATSIEESACQYKWDCGSIPMELRESFQDGIYPGTGNLKGTMAILKALREALRDSRNAGDSERHLKACWAVLHWGGVASAGNLEFYALKHFVRNESGVSDLVAYHRAAHDLGGWFDPVATTSSRLQDNVQHMTAGVTKIHSLIDDGLLIYDSRVACALAWLVERYCDSVNGGASGTACVPGTLVFCLPAERSGKAVRDPDKVRSRNKSALNHPTPYVSPGYTPAGRKLWTIDMWRASRILAEILKGLGHTDENESVCEDYFLKYQLGLFMIGYHLGDHSVLP